MENWRGGDPTQPTLFFPSIDTMSVSGAWNGDSWLGCGDLPTMRVVFYLGAAWPQWNNNKVNNSKSVFSV